jgi:hypothetical protein
MSFDYYYEEFGSGEHFSYTVVAIMSKYTVHIIEVFYVQERGIHQICYGHA